MFIHFFSLCSSRFLSFSRHRSNKRAKKRASEGARLGRAKNWGEGEREGGGGGDPYFVHSPPVSFPSRKCFFFRTSSQFRRSLRVSCRRRRGLLKLPSFWKRVLRRLSFLLFGLTIKLNFNIPTVACSLYEPSLQGIMVILFIKTTYPVQDPEYNYLDSPQVRLTVGIGHCSLSSNFR